MQGCPLVNCYDCASIPGGNAVVFGFNLMSTHPQQAVNMSAYAAYASTYSDRAHRIGFFVNKASTQVRYRYFTVLSSFKYTNIIIYKQHSHSITLETGELETKSRTYAYLIKLLFCSISKPFQTLGGWASASIYERFT